jgi:hypothetical protein
MIERDSSHIEWVRRLSARLGRQTRLSNLLDWVAARTVKLPAMPRVAFAGGPKMDDLLHAPKQMATGPGAQDAAYVRPAPTTPHAEPLGGSGPWTPTEPWWDIFLGPAAIIAHRARKGAANKAHAKAACAPEKYHGMHGMPCAYAGGTDLKCPAGTISGYWWTYKISTGVIYYIDCCGGTQKGTVWCNWTEEDNWCRGAGRAVNQGASLEYNCTLAVPDSLMKTATVGTGLEAVDVDP